MIQRKQSIFLFLAGLISAIFALNVLKGYIFTTGIESENVYYFSFGFFFSGFLSFLGVLLFKNRKNQMRLCIANLIFNILLIGFAAFVLLNLPGGFDSEKGIWFLVPLVSMALIFIAYRLILKDEKLVKSVDRFR